MKLKKFAAISAAMTIALSAAAVTNGAERSVLVNGEQVKGTIFTDKGVDYLPLRSVAEALGFEVEWNGESKSISMSNMPQYVTMTIGVDGYTFAKTAPMPLGAAPVIKDSTTYVPSAVFSDLLSYSVENTDENVNIVSLHDVTVIEVADGRITVEDAERGEVVLVIGENTLVTDNMGNKVNPDIIEAGDTLTIEYDVAMTMSIPPLNNPKSVIVLKEFKEETSTEVTTADETSTEATTTDETSTEVTTVDETSTEATTTDETSTETTTDEASTETTTIEE